MALITLIRPASLFSPSALTLTATPPLSLAYLAGSIAEAGHEVAVIDAVGEGLDNVYPAGVGDLLANGLSNEQVISRIAAETRVVGISCLFTHEWPNIRALAQAIRARFPDVLLVCGGEHVTAEPDYSLSDCSVIDCIVLGEGEETFDELVAHCVRGESWRDVEGIAYLEAGQVVCTPRRKRIKAIDEVPLPRWDLTPIENYLEQGLSFGVNRGRTIPMLATRGCPFQCTFCSSPQMWTTRWVARDPVAVVNEIKSYIRDYNVTNIDFYDLTAVVRRDWVVDFCKHLIAEDLGISWQLPSGTRSEAIDAEVAQLLYQSGCTNLSYAPESGSPRVFKKIKKKVNLDNMIESMRDAVKSGINVKANMIIGFPGETHTDIWRSFLFVARAAVTGLNDASIWIYSPYPGCSLFDELREKGKIGAFDDEYFISLLSYADIKNVTSWNDLISAGTLKYYRILGIMMFYFVSYLSNPMRAFRTIRNIWCNSHESRMEMVLANTFKRMWQSFRQKEALPTNSR